MAISNVPGSTVGAVNRSSPSMMPTPKTAQESVASSSPTDQVSLSPLARSLHDESLVVFNALSDDQRGQLSSLVDSGQLSGEEVHDALKQRLKEARRSAFSATRRMFANDSAELRASSDTPSTEKLNTLLRATLDRRSGMVDSLSDLERNGGKGAQAYQDLSGQLASRTMNPLLNSARAATVFLPSLELDTSDSRIMSTRKEGDAAYKLKATSFNLDDLDRSIRSIGEKDAASLIREKAGLPGGSSVPKDADFSLDDAILKPILGTTAGQATTEAMPDFFSGLRSGALVSTGTVGIYEITGAAAGNAASTPQGAPRNSLPKQDPVELDRKQRYQVGLFANYA